MPVLTFRDQDSKAKPPVVAGWVLEPSVDPTDDAEGAGQPTPVSPAQALLIATVFDAAITRITGQPGPDFLGMVRAANAQARDRAANMVRTATISAEYATNQVALYERALADWNAADGDLDRSAVA